MSSGCASPRGPRQRFGRKVSWGVTCGGITELFTTASVPVMTRLRMTERSVLDTLIDAGVARSRSEALAWCVRLVGEQRVGVDRRAAGGVRACARRSGQGPRLGPHPAPGRRPGLNRPVRLRRSPARRALGQGVPRQGGALDADRELDHALEGLEVAELDARAVRRAVAVAVLSPSSPTVEALLVDRHHGLEAPGPWRGPRRRSCP